MIKSDNKISTNGYVDKEGLFEILDTNPSFLTSIVKGFNIDVILDSKRKYYKIDDLKNAIEEVEQFYENHYIGYYVYKNFYSREYLSKTWVYKHTVSIPKHYRGILRSKYAIGASTIFYKKEDINKFIKEKEIQNKIDGYIDRDKVFEMLEITHPEFKLKETVANFKIETKELYPKLYYKLDDINRVILEVTNFFNKYYTSKEATKIVTLSTLQRKGVSNIDMPKHYQGILNKTFSTRGITKVYEKKVIDELRKELDNKKKSRQEKKEKAKKQKENINNLISNGKYISRFEVHEKLGFSGDFNSYPQLLAKLRNQNYIRFISIDSDKNFFYNLEDVENIKKQRDKFSKEFLALGNTGNANNSENSISEYFKKHNLNYRHFLCKLKKYDVPIYCLGGDFTSVGAIKKEDADILIKKTKDFKSSLIRTDKTGYNHFETFLIRAESYKDWKGFEKTSVVTIELFLDFIKRQLDIEGQKSSVDMKIKKCIKLGINLRNIIDKNEVEEVHHLTSSQINLYLRTMKSKTDREFLLYFLTCVNTEIRRLGHADKLRYNVNNLKLDRKENDNEDWDNVEHDLYNFEVYSEVFKFLIDIKSHIPKIINELAIKGTAVHASIWLYTMLHLNNAWRHGDCNSFPELNIADLLEEYNIDSINWFENNELSLPQAKSIVFRVRQWELRISKTQIKGVFFCSDTLAPAFATAVIILHLFKRRNNIILDTKNTNKFIMNFDNQENTVSSSKLKTFFKPAKIKGFTFSSRKFNKSIMTYIYFLSNLSGDEKALIYSQEMRRHINPMSTTYYVDFDIKHVESLSGELFSRGEFGFIPTLLAEKVLGQGETGSFKEMTNQVMAINAVFGDIQNINNTSRALNTIRKERQNVIDMISEKSFEECQRYLTSLFTRNLPSKCSADIQCLFSKQGCQMPNLDDNDDIPCFDCPYHIPSIYALTRLCGSLVDNYKVYLGLPKSIELKNFKNYLIQHPETKPQLTTKSKMQIGIKIERRKVLLKEALKKFGPEYVYRCLDMDRQDFIVLSDLVKGDFFTNFPKLINRFKDK